MYYLWEKGMAQFRYTALGLLGCEGHRWPQPLCRVEPPGIDSIEVIFVQKTLIDFVEGSVGKIFTHEMLQSGHFDGRLCFCEVSTLKSNDYLPCAHISYTRSISIVHTLSSRHS